MIVIGFSIIQWVNAANVLLRMGDCDNVKIQLSLLASLY